MQHKFANSICVFFLCCTTANRDYSTVGSENFIEKRDHPKQKAHGSGSLDISMLSIQIIYSETKVKLPTKFYLSIGKGRTSNFGVSNCSVSIAPLLSQGKSELQSSSRTVKLFFENSVFYHVYFSNRTYCFLFLFHYQGSAEFTNLDKDTDGMSNSILAMPPRLSNEKFLEAYEVVLVLDDRETFGFV
jgi:hypothetical protein